MSNSTALAKPDVQVKQALATIDAFTQAIQKATSFGETKVLISESKKFQLHVREYKLGREALLRGAEAQLRGELRAGAIAVHEAKNPDYSQVLEDARLTPDQVNRWRREADALGFVMSDEVDDLWATIEKKIQAYMQSIRETTEAQIPSFRDFLSFHKGEGHEEDNKGERTEITKQFCKFHPIERAQEEVNQWLADPGTSRAQKQEIAEMWEGVLRQGAIFKGQTAIPVAHRVRGKK